jgi:hypothetical protein
MRHRIISWAVLVVFLFVGVIGAQETATKIDLPELTLEQKVSRQAWLAVGSAVLGISFAKSVGKTAEDYGRYMVELWAPGWSANKGSPIRMIRVMYLNSHLNPNYKMEIFDSSEIEVKGRMTATGIDNFAGGMYYGVSLDEYMSCGKVWREGLAGYLDLVWEEEFDGEWVNFTLTVKQ